MAYNIAHLGKINDWFLKQKIKYPWWSIYFNNVVVTPAYLNPRVLPNKILEKIDVKFPNINYTTNNNSKLLDTFVNYTKDVDKLRDTNILDHCPELTDLFV
jgi:hypothetical protein